MKKNLNHNFLEVCAFILIFSGLIILLYFLYSASANYEIAKRGNISLQDSYLGAGVIGGLVGTIWSFASLILFYRTLVMQKESFINQRDEYHFNKCLEVVYKQLDLLKQELLLLNFKIDDEILTIVSVSNYLRFNKFMSFKAIQDLAKKKKDFDVPDIKTMEFSNLLSKMEKYLVAGVNLKVDHEMKMKLFEINLFNFASFVDKIDTAVDILSTILKESSIKNTAQNQIWTILKQNLTDELFIINELSNVYVYDSSANYSVTEILGNEYRISSKSYYLKLILDRSI